MKSRIGMAFITGLLALGLPAGAPAGQLSRSDFKNVSKYCKALRSEMDTPATPHAFEDAYGTNANKRNAHGKCVSRRGVAVTSVPAPPAVEPPLPVSAFGQGQPASATADQGAGKHAGKHQK